MSEWTIDDVATRFSEAADTGRRLPRVGVQGYFNVWPVFARDAWEGFDDKDVEYRPLPPTPQAIERMLETMRWVQWLELEQRHLDLDAGQAVRVAGHRSASRLHRMTRGGAGSKALERVATKLNGPNGLEARRVSVSGAVSRLGDCPFWSVRQLVTSGD